MEQISATIITRNEERNIERCLNALQGVADEIVVVDSYSNDRTLEICHRYGCKITSREFQGFGSQRQYAAGLTSHKYVLSVDADEVLDEDLRRCLMQMKTEGFKHRVYAMQVHNYFCGRPVRHSGLEPTRHVRLFNKRYANWNLRDVSDRVSYPDSVTPAPLPGSIHHYRCCDIEEFVRKENRIAALRAKVLATGNSSIGPLTPHMRAGIEYLKSHLIDLAWLDGSTGHIIANRRYKTTYEAYHMARHIILEQK